MGKKVVFKCYAILMSPQMNSASLSRPTIYSIKTTPLCTLYWTEEHVTTVWESLETDWCGCGTPNASSTQNHFFVRYSWRAEPQPPWPCGLAPLMDPTQSRRAPCSQVDLFNSTFTTFWSDWKVLIGNIKILNGYCYQKKIQHLESIDNTFSF